MSEITAEDEVNRSARFRLSLALLAAAFGCLLAPAWARAQELVVSPQGWASLEGKTYRCALGRGGVKLDKREGDGATPAGVFPLRRVFYRPDKLFPPPKSGLPVSALAPDRGWCDDPQRPEYNQAVTLPFEGSREELWRADDLYDLIVVVGYNDAPPVAGLGSAIFLHVAAPGFRATAGCVSFSGDDLAEIVSKLGPQARVKIVAGP